MQCGKYIWSGSCLLMLVLATAGFSCNNLADHSKPVALKKEISAELDLIDSLLRDSSFALAIAQSQESAYYEGIGQTPPPFLNPEEERAEVSIPLWQQKIAINLAGFYALECGLGALCADTKQTPVSLLEKIAGGTAGTDVVLLLNRFANATWKAGQPFRSLDRITRRNFVGAHALSKAEVDKDAVQIRNAADKLLTSMQPVKSDSMPRQMEALRGLLQDTAYAEEMAAYLEAAYTAGQGQKPAPFLTPADRTTTVRKNAKEQKIATNLAGFYAMECAMNYLVITQNLRPSAVLNSLQNGSMSKSNKLLFARFANATWKAGQPFRGLDRITRPIFTPFYYLTEDDIEKDLVQVSVAAKTVLPLLKK